MLSRASSWASAAPWVACCSRVIWRARCSSVGEIRPGTHRAGWEPWCLQFLGWPWPSGGGLVVLFARSLVGLQLHICADGFWFRRANQQWVFAWDEIVLVNESVIEERLPLAKGAARYLMPTKTTRTYTVVRCDGEEFYFDENVIPRTSLLAGPLSAVAAVDKVAGTVSGGRRQRKANNGA
jgi:hypothetical protein